MWSISRGMTEMKPATGFWKRLWAALSVLWTVVVGLLCWLDTRGQWNLLLEHPGTESGWVYSLDGERKYAPWTNDKPSDASAPKPPGIEDIDWEHSLDVKDGIEWHTWYVYTEGRVFEVNRSDFVGVKSRQDFKRLMARGELKVDERVRK